MRDNSFIKTGYRQPIASLKYCFSSLFFIHNETVNIYSHLIGALIFITLMFTTKALLIQTTPSASSTDILFTYIFLAGAVSCLLMSSVYHTTKCHSENVSKLLNKCDYIGITLLIVTSCFPIIFYAFRCSSYLQLSYIILLSTLGAFASFISIYPSFAIPKYRKFRALIFVLLGVSAVVPISHSIILFGTAHTFHSTQLAYILPMAAFYILGAFLYACRLPESLFPGKFDIWFHSHQIFHCFVLIAALFHYHGVIKALNWAHLNAPTCTNF
ncbi:Adiponectin receptor protein 2 [Smittium culicis]|uniref:Adiponectin receptor protein 2 n=1 Tax=Smittium culicis TaxID=133412 RepID=A0A1R1YTL8_9FUNG|nr:Adiponectin receptor protein 2 [Smittium culicis]